MKPNAADRLPALDGLRAISITLVLLGHLAGTRGWPLSASSRLGAFSEFGVRVFFVISGFLITTLLIKEHARSGTISLKDFYIRRTYRIFPAFYTYLAVVAVLSIVGIVELLENDLLAAVTYTMNFHRPRAWGLGHLWSLSVEEQFYLVWPAVMLIARPRHAFYIAALAIFAAPLIRVAVWIGMPAHRLGIGETFPTIFDALAAGCLLGGLQPWLAERRSYLRFSRSLAFIVVPLVAVIASQIHRVSFQLLVGHTIQNVAIALSVDWAVRRHDTLGARLVGRLLEVRPLVWVGRLSYSLYLWQQPFMQPHGDRYWQTFPVNLVAALVLASLSYYLVEQPVLRLRDRRAASRKTVPALPT